VAGWRALPVLDGATRALCDRVADRLEEEAEDLAETMTAGVFEDIPAYATIATAEERATVLMHSRDHVRAVVLAIRTWSLPAAEELRFVNARASLRAGQRMPLSAMLQSYRVGHRTVWERMVRVLAGLDNDLNAALALTTLTLSYTELISGALAEAYVEQQRGMLVQLDRDRRDLLEVLLLGTVDRQADVRQLASNFALVPGGDFLVVVLACLSAAAGPTGEVLSRAAETLRGQLSLGVAQPFVVVRHGEVVSIAPLGRARPAAIARLVRLAHADLNQNQAQPGARWAGGISTRCAGLGEVARGYQEARHARESATEDAGVRVLFEVRVSDYLLERADGTAVRMIPSAARRLLESRAPGDRILVETLLAYAAAELSIRVAADHLAVHPNTVSYRLQKLGRLLECNLSVFSEVVEVVTWARLIERSRRVDQRTVL